MSERFDDGWRLASASVAGASHARTGLECQDAFAVRVSMERAVLAVADGAGSAAHARRGAETAASRAAAVLEGATLPAATDADAWRALFTGAMQAALAALSDEADRLDAAPEALATTLLLVMATAGVTAVGQIGDGAVVAEDPGGVLVALTVPTTGEYANTTVFLTSPNAITTAQFGLFPPSPRLALFSDGLQRLALDMATGEPYAPFFAPLFRFVESEADAAARTRELEAFLSSRRIQERTDDDLTLLIAASPA